MESEESGMEFPSARRVLKRIQEDRFTDKNSVGALLWFVFILSAYFLDDLLKDTDPGRAQIAALFYLGTLLFGIFYSYHHNGMDGRHDFLNRFFLVWQTLSLRYIFIFIGIFIVLGVASYSSGFRYSADNFWLVVSAKSIFLVCIGLGTGNVLRKVDSNDSIINGESHEG